MFDSISPYDLPGNTFDLIDNQWMLITAGKETRINMMTANWGGFGVLWYKPIITCYIRPQRYTRKFVDKNDYLSLSFFENDYREVLQMCGEKSGLDCDKLTLSGLTPLFDKSAPYFSEAKMVLICRKLYRQKLKSSSFIDTEIDKKEYEAGDYHYMYVCEITDVLVKTPPSPKRIK